VRRASRRLHPHRPPRLSPRRFGGGRAARAGGPSGAGTEGSAGEEGQGDSRARGEEGEGREEAAGRRAGEEEPEEESARRRAGEREGCRDRRRKTEGLALSQEGLGRREALGEGEKAQGEVSRLELQVVWDEVRRLLQHAARHQRRSPLRGAKLELGDL